MTDWCGVWGLKLSVPKCCVLPLGAGLSTAYTLCGQALPPATDNLQKDLGFLISPSLSFTQHVDSICTKARQMMALVSRAFLSPDLSVLVSAYRIYVRPSLEYGIPVFNSLSSADSYKIERVQKWASKLILRRCHMRQREYSDRLRLLKLKSLHHRRIVMDLAFTHKVYRGQHFCPGLLLRKPETRPLSHNHRLMHNSELRGKQSLVWPERTVQHWNSLPDHCIEGSYDQLMLFLKP